MFNHRPTTSRNDTLVWNMIHKGIFGPETVDDLLQTGSGKFEEVKAVYDSEIVCYLWPRHYCGPDTTVARCERKL